MPTRRFFLAASGLLWLAPRGPAAAAPLQVPPQVPQQFPQQVPLWPSLPPGGGGPSGPVRHRRGGISNISVPMLDIFPADRPNGLAVLVAAGGGYRHIQNENEAFPAARWLNGRGITAFVLSYRLPGEGWGAGPLAPLQDAQRALRLIRAGAARFGIQADRIGVMGFSAGGHLMGLAATRPALVSYERVDAADQISARPDFASLIYPVITLKPPYDRTSSRRELIGEHPDPQLAAEWSVETHVTAHCPPIFLVQAKDDPVSDPHNTQIMQAACQTAGVPVELDPLEDGGHGFGMGRPGTASMGWPAAFSAWLARTFPD